MLLPGYDATVLGAHEILLMEPTGRVLRRSVPYLEFGAYCRGLGSLTG